MEIEDIVKKIPKIKYYNISYRNYFGLINGYIVMVYPFVTALYKINKHINNFATNGIYHHLHNNKDIEEIFRGHEINFNKGDFYFSPCMMYEKVSGYKIHTLNEEDNFGFPKEYYTQNCIDFDKALKCHIRKEKLNKILS